jgi:tRNA(fMet)-specific endonuclease VapC
MSHSLLLDTMVFSEILRKNHSVTTRLWRELRNGATVLVSPMVYYELRRGLLKKDAQRLMQKLEEMIARHLWIETTRSDWETAASLWAKLQRKGHPIPDDDIIIAAQANNRGATVVTDNVSHFRELADHFETWS